MRLADYGNMIKGKFNAFLSYFMLSENPVKVVNHHLHKDKVPFFLVKGFFSVFVTGPTLPLACRFISLQFNFISTAPLTISVVSSCSTETQELSPNGGSKTSPLTERNLEQDQARFGGKP